MAQKLRSQETNNNEINTKRRHSDLQELNFNQEYKLIT